jgi:sugar phosphate isomerase/epimerase
MRVDPALVPSHPPYAHSLADQPEERWEPLAEHLENVAGLAARFAAGFGAEAWGASGTDVGQREA